MHRCQFSAMEAQLMLINDTKLLSLADKLSSFMYTE